jgi:phage terminase Nu1 subunit (DNA packaging protein)
MTAIPAIAVPAARKANKALLAAWFGVSVPTVDSWLRRGCPYSQRGDKGNPWVFDLMEVARWRFGHVATPGDDRSPEDLSPKERKDWYEGEKVRVGLEVEKGNLITLDEYRTEMARILKRVATTLETLPDTLERKCALAPEIVAKMQDELDKERSLLASALVSDDGDGAPQSV